MISNKDRLVREREILFGNPRAIPPTPPIIPVSRRQFRLLVENGRIPKPIKISERCELWRMSDLEAFVENGEGQK